MWPILYFLINFVLPILTQLKFPLTVLFLVLKGALLLEEILIGLFVVSQKYLHKSSGL